MYITYELPRLTPLKFRKDLAKIYRRVLRGEPCQIEVRLSLHPEDTTWKNLADAHNARKCIKTALINNTQSINSLVCNMAGLPYAAFRLHEIRQQDNTPPGLPNWPSPQENTISIFHITRTDIPEKALNLLKAIHLF